MEQSDTCRRITSVNKKGGVGKTFMCWLIASVCQEVGKRCLVVDLDPQANLTSSFVEAESGFRTVDEVFDPARDPKLVELIAKTEFEFIDIVPASAKLAEFNDANPVRLWENDLHQSLAEGLRDVQQDYDYVLFDCPPSLSLVTYAAMCASDFVMVPLEAAKWGALGTQHVISAIDVVRGRSNSRLQLLGYVVSRYKARRSYQQTYLAELRNILQDETFETLIPDLAIFEKSVTDRIPITLHSPTSHASDIARQFFEEVEARCQKLSRRSQPIGS